MFGFSKESVPGKRKKKRANMEFDFITGPAPVSRPAVVKKTPPLTAEPSAAPVPEVKKVEEPKPVFTPKPEPQPEPQAFKKSEEPAPAQVHRKPEPPKEESPSMSSSPFSEPAPIRATESIRRQQKEQNTVNKMLNGIVIGIICFVLIVTASAGFGGYVMWKQIQGQSVTITQLDSKLSDRLMQMQSDLEAGNKKLADELAVSNQQLAETNKQLADANKQIADLKRTQAQMQRQINTQGAAIDRVRSYQIR